MAAQASSDLVNTTFSKDLYNGNIARMVTTITDPTTRNVLPMGNAYLYDQLNRLLTSRSFDNINISANTWGGGGTQRYRNNFTYDANGNIKTQTRKDYAGTGVIDSLAYKYEELSGEKVRNRLYHVDDSQTNTALFTDDVDDMGTLVTGSAINTSNNYGYDEEGRLIKDVQEGIASIVWRADGKVKSIIRPSGNSKKNITFDYDAMGHRIAKHIYTSANVLEKSTYYVLDAQGNVMSTYVREIVSSTVYFSQKEKYIYGSLRLGVLNDSIPLLGSQNSTYSQTTWTHSIGKRNYEISNHLGNVLAVISDKVLLKDAGTYNTSTGAYISATLDNKTDWFLADILQANDYSAFGVQLSERSFRKGGFNRKTKRGFNGMEMDNEIHPGSDGLAEGDSYDFGARMYDPRLGRFLSLDPLKAKFPASSPYSFAKNSPLLFVDFEGEHPKVAVIMGSEKEFGKPHAQALEDAGYEVVYVATAEQMFEKLNLYSSPDSPIENLILISHAWTDGLAGLDKNEGGLYTFETLFADAKDDYQETRLAEYVKAQGIVDDSNDPKYDQDAYSTVSDMAKRMADIAFKDPDAILTKALILAYKEKKGARTVNDLTELIESKKINVSGKLVVVLGGCNTAGYAYNEKDGYTFAMDLAKHLRCTVFGSDGWTGPVSGTTKRVSNENQQGEDKKGEWVKITKNGTTIRLKTAVLDLANPPQ